MSVLNINNDLQILLKAKGAPAELIPLVKNIAPKQCIQIAKDLADVKVEDTQSSAILWCDLLWVDSPLTRVTRNDRLPRAIIDVHSPHFRLQYFNNLIRRLS